MCYNKKRVSTLGKDSDLMLKLKNITKEYVTGDSKVEALKGIDRMSLFQFSVSQVAVKPPCLILSADLTAIPTVTCLLKVNQQSYIKMLTGTITETIL